MSEFGTSQHRRLRILSLTMPAHGHYMTIKGIVLGLRRTGHDVTFALCEQSRPAFELDRLSHDEGINFLSAGLCNTYDGRELALRQLIAKPGDLTAMRTMLDGVAQLSADMCELDSISRLSTSRISI